MSEESADKHAISLEDQFRLQEYHELIDYLKFQHTRYTNFSTMCWLANSALLGFVGYLFTHQKDYPELFVISPILALAGIIICVIWLLTIYRVDLEAKRLCWQLRDRECRMGMSAMFREGHKFFIKKETLESEDSDKKGILAFPNSGHPSRFKAIYASQFIAVLFGLLHIFAIGWFFMSEKGPGAFATTSILFACVITGLLGFIIGRGLFE